MRGPAVLRYFLAAALTIVLLVLTALLGIGAYQTFKWYGERKVEVVKTVKTKIRGWTGTGVPAAASVTK
jgi:hypothetical protein